MKKILAISFVAIAVLVILGLAGYRLWFYNPYPDILRLDATSVFQRQQAAEGLLIQNATLIDVEAGRAIPNGQLLIRGDTIAEVIFGGTPELSPGMELFDAQNKFIMPGLFDVHVHLAPHMHLLDGSATPSDSLAGKAALEQFVRYGVTTVLAFGGGGSNDEQAAEYKRLERSNAIVAPWLFATGDVITAPGSHPITTIMRLSADTGPERLHKAGVTVVTDDDDPKSLIANKKLMGLDGVKIILESGPPPWHPNPRLSVKAAGKIIEQANRQGLPVYAHAHAYEEFTDAVQLGVKGIMHGVQDSLIHDRQLIERLKQEEIWYTPTLSVIWGFQVLKAPERLDDGFLQAGVSRRAIRYLENPLFRFGFGQTLRGYDLSGWLETNMQNLARLQKEGVNIALGTDASTPFNFPGYSAHIEMELMSRAGLSNAEILRIATLNGARFLGIEDQVGTIAPGKIANLLLLNDNPLTAIRHTRGIHRVVLKGKVIDPGFKSFGAMDH